MTGFILYRGEVREVGVLDDRVADGRREVVMVFLEGEGKINVDADDLHSSVESLVLHHVIEATVACGEASGGLAVQIQQALGDVMPGGVTTELLEMQSLMDQPVPDPVTWILPLLVRARDILEWAISWARAVSYGHPGREMRKGIEEAQNSIARIHELLRLPVPLVECSERQPYRSDLIGAGFRPARVDELLNESLAYPEFFGAGHGETDRSSQNNKS